MAYPADLVDHPELARPKSTVIPPGATRSLHRPRPSWRHFGSDEAFATIMRSLRERLFVLPDTTWVYPGHGDDTTLGAERPQLDEWEARGW